MKRLLLLAACAALAGCDYTVPLAKAPSMDADASLVGLWERIGENGQPESLLVLPLGKQEYMVSYPAAAKDGMFARACLVRCAGRTLAQIEWIGSARGTRPDDGRLWQFAAFERSGEKLKVRMLNADTVSRDVKTTEELAAAVEKNKESPDLFRSEMVFTKAAE